MSSRYFTLNRIVSCFLMWPYWICLMIEKYSLNFFSQFEWHLQFLSDIMSVSSREFLDIQATSECGFTLKCGRDMITTSGHLLLNLEHTKIQTGPIFAIFYERDKLISEYLMSKFSLCFYGPFQCQSFFLGGASTSICHFFCSSICPSVVHHISGTVHHLIIIFGTHV